MLELPMLPLPLLSSLLCYSTSKKADRSATARAARDIEHVLHTLSILHKRHRHFADVFESCYGDIYI